jgi:hypothetical protein
MSDRHKPEKLQRDLLEQIYLTSKLNTFELFRNFPVFTPRYNLARFLSHYEIFKHVIDVPGTIIDLGVFCGASTFTWAKLCEIFCPTDIKKKVYGFDTFEGFVTIDKEDGPLNPDEDVIPGGYNGGPSIMQDLELAQQAMDCDRHLNHISRIEFIKGDVNTTIPDFVKLKGDGLRISLLNLDLDLYRPTYTALENFAPLMSPGGIIIVDEYAVDTFGGESKAVDEFFIKFKGKRPRIIKFPWHSNPSGYIKVEW